jgi:hypothetical protein
VLTDECRDLIGDRLIAYMLGVSVADLDTVLADPGDDRVDVLGLVAEVGNVLLAQSQAIPTGRELVLTGLVSPDRDVPLANRIRGLAVETPPIDLADRPLALLSAIAFDCLPALIAEDAHLDPTSWLNPARPETILKQQGQALPRTDPPVRVPHRPCRPRTRQAAR